MVRNVAGVMTELEPEDFYLLSGVEQGMRFSEWVNRGKLPQLSGLSPEEVGYRLDRCATRELIERKTIQYEGYTLKAEGYDALALRTFSKRETVDGSWCTTWSWKRERCAGSKILQTTCFKIPQRGIHKFS